MVLETDLYSSACPEFVPNVHNYVPVNCKYYDFSSLPVVFSVFINIIMINIGSCKIFFNTFIAYFAQFLASFSCIILTETWLTKESDNFYNKPGFCHYDLYCDHQGGGIKIFVKNGIYAKIIRDFALMNDYFEMLSVELTVNCRKILLSALYHPPSSSHVNNRAFIDSFTTLLGQLSCLQLPTFVCGDFNLILFNPYGLTFINEFVQSMLELDFAPCITIPTIINPDSPITKFSLVDHVWVSRGNIAHSFVTPVDITNHYPVGLSIDLPATQGSNKSSMVRSLKERGKTTFKLLLSHFNFNFENLADNFDIDFQNYFRQLFEIYERAFPLFKKTEKTKKPSPWMTLKLKECIRKKANLYKLHLKGKISKTDYVYFKNRLTNTLRTPKRLYYARVFLEAAGKSNKIWFKINSIMERKKVTFIESMKVNGVMLYGRELANHFNNHFAAAASLITSGSFLPLNCLFYAVPILESCFFYPTDSQEVLKIIKSFKDKGSKLLDISPQIIKENSTVLSSHFSELYNISLREMVFPSTLKIGKITPAHKSRSTDDADNFRPITTLPALSKILERLTLNRMDKFIAMHSLLSPSQFGFRHGKSTTHTIIKLLSHVTSAFHKQIYCVSFFLRLA